MKLFHARYWAQLLCSALSSLSLQLVKTCRRRQTERRGEKFSLLLQQLGSSHLKLCHVPIPHRRIDTVLADSASVFCQAQPFLFPPCEAEIGKPSVSAVRRRLIGRCSSLIRAETLARRTGVHRRRKAGTTIDWCCCSRLPSADSLLLPLLLV